MFALACICLSAYLIFGSIVVVASAVHACTFHCGCCASVVRRGLVLGGCSMYLIRRNFGVEHCCESKAKAPVGGVSFEAFAGLGLPHDFLLFANNLYFTNGL